MQPRCRFVLLISGVPASGKSTVARELARVLPGFALLGKDAIKEALFEGLSAEERAEPGLSRRLSDAAMETLWTGAQAYERVILEANFRTRDAGQRENVRKLEGKTLEVHCRCEPAEAARRFARRAASRHPVHTLQVLGPELLAESNEPFGMGPVIEVDTTLPFRVEEVLRRVRAHWPGM